MSAPAARPRLEVLSVAHDVADARLQRICAEAHEAGFIVSMRGHGRTADGPASVGIAVWPAAGMTRRIWRAVTAPFGVRADVVVVVDPDLFPSALLARRVRRFGLVVCDVHEDYRRLSADRDWRLRGLGWFVGLVAAGLVRLSAQADVTWVADDHLPPRRARRRRVVRNVPALSDRPPEAGDPQRRAVYVGDVRRSRGAFTMIEAVRDCPPWELDVVGPVNNEDDARHIDELIAGCDRIRLWGRQPPEESWRIAEGASVGLSILDNTPAFRAAIPSKVYQYLEAGMAVITSPLPRVAALVDDAGVGAVASSPSGIADRLRRWSDQPSELQVCRQRARCWSKINLDAEDPFRGAVSEVVEMVHAARGDK